MDDLQLIEGCREGKRESQKNIYEKYASSMYAVCLRYTSNEEAARDLLHDGFIKIFSVIGSFSGRGSFEGWMKRVFINLALEGMRKEKITIFADDMQNISETTPEDDEIEKDISEDELIKMVQELPKGYRSVFNLYAIENLSHKQIAQMLGIAEGTSRSQYIRARQILQEKVMKYLKVNR